MAYALTVRGADVLFTGDIEPTVASDVAARWRTEGLGRAEVFLATLHGSRYGSLLR